MNACLSEIIGHDWAALRKMVSNVLSCCHTERRMGMWGRAHPSFGMTPTFSNFFGGKRVIYFFFFFIEHTCAYARWAHVPRFLSVCRHLTKTQD